jgi:RHS repeat-associated protein
MYQSSPQSSQAFGYDGADRLTNVTDIFADPSLGTTTCTQRLYGYDADSNRTSLSTYPDTGADPTNGSCSTTSTTATSTFDQADRITNSGYSYDTLGRTTAVPAANAIGSGTHNGVSGSLTVGYYVNDMVASQTQGASTMTYTLDPAQNRIASFIDAGASTANHYSDSGDSPSWTATGTTWIRNLSAPDGDLAATVDQAGTVTLQLMDPHGDVVATAQDSTSATGTLSYEESTEFGQSRRPSAAYTTYGWVGGKKRSSDALGGVVLMGARLYNPSTGRFLSTDPILGGTPSAYVYPPDPINAYDLTGTHCGWGFVCHVAHAVAKHWRAIAQVATFLAAGAVVGAVCTASVGLGCLATAIGLGAVSGGARYAEGTAGTRRFTGAGLAEHAIFGAATGYALYPWRALADGSFVRWGLGVARRFFTE